MDPRGLAGRDRLLAVTLGARGATPLGAAAFTLIAGFGALGTWYVALVSRGDVGASLRGISRFLTGSLGDALLLPVAAALTIVAYRGFADLLATASEEPALEVAAERVERVLLGHLVAVGPWLLSVAIVAWYHWPWITDPSFWERFAPASARMALVPAVYHAAFMIAALWWLLAFLVRLVLLGAALPPAAARSRRVPAPFVHALSRAWRATLALCGVLLAFTALLYYDRFGPELFWRSTERHPEAVLCVVLAPIVIAAVAWYDRAFVARVRRDAATGES